MITKAKLYLTCVLCRDGGAIGYPEDYDCSDVEVVGDPTDRLVAATVCHSCFFEPKNGPALEYLSEYGVTVTYVSSTLVNFEAIYGYTGTVTIASRDGLTADIFDIHFLTDKLTKDCVLRSMEYDDNRMFEVPSEYSFFGPLTTSRRNS